MKRFFLKLIILLVPIISIIVITNYIVDPAHLFSNGEYEHGITKMLCSGKNVTNIMNYDGRLLKKYMIESLPFKPEVLVFGSSRAMQINQQNYQNDKLLNCCVSNGSIEDYLGIYNLIEKQGFKPSLVILGLDPWVLNEKTGSSLYKSIEKEFEEMLKKLNLESTVNKASFIQQVKDRFYKRSELFSFAYFQKAINNFNERTYSSTDSIVNESYTIFKDGSCGYGIHYREQSQNSIENDISKTTQRPDLLLDFDKLSGRNKLYLESFISYLHSHEIRVVCFLPPYHPKVYDFFSKNENFKIVLEAESYYRDLCKKNSISIMGSYNPYLIPMQSSEFYDALHVRLESLNKVFDYKTK